MVEEKNRGKWLGKDVGSHVRCRDPHSREGTISDMVTDKVMANINMFGSRRDSVGFGDDAGTLIVTENRKGVGSWKFSKGQKKF